MNQHFRSGPFGWLCAGLVTLGVSVAALGQFGSGVPSGFDGPILLPKKAQANPEPAEVKALKQASMNGKYSKLLTVINVPGDLGAYGEVNDWGHWTGTEWAGYTGLPQGYWVYVHPHWYIWGQEGKAAAQANPQPGKDVPAKASANGKYANLLKVIDVPGDMAQYGEFNDYGFWNGNSWAGFDNLPQGYWVYLAPKWYIWGKEGQQQQAAPAPGDAAKISANGKYINLLKVIDVPADKATYGEYNDYGYYEGTEWAGHQNLPPGYWVYVAPKWYIWGKEFKQQQAPQPGNVDADQAKAAVNGKYSQLLRVINVPQDQADYGAFSDYGHYTGTEWAGYDNLPVGYWVYVAPNWYIWGKQGGQQANPKIKGAPEIIIPGTRGFLAAPPGAAPAPPIAPADNVIKASVNRKYYNLLKVIDVPGDQGSYGQFYDWGHWTGTSWANHQNLPPGYWVYVAPNWYIWGGVRGEAAPAPPVPVPPPPAAVGGDQAKAAVNGKYAKLLKVINVPQDQATYGAFSDYGYYTGTSWAGFDNLPPGYWVYVAPNWYIWGEQK